MLVYKQGDILKSDEKIIVHGCNCFNTMGSGIARQVKEKYPLAYEADKSTVRGDKNKLGSFSYALNPNGVTIVNAYTQYRYGRDKVYVDYDALEKVFGRICYFCSATVVAMPKIGCGLAGGDWNKVSEILTKISDKHKKIFHVYEFNGVEENVISKDSLDKKMNEYRLELSDQLKDWKVG